MAFIVEMAGREKEDRNYFCCGGLVWVQLLQLARENGWQPLGTSPDPIWKDLWDERGKFMPSYECDEYGKMISGPDAAAFASALEQASKQLLPALPKGPTLIREGMNGDTYRCANAEIDQDFITEFTTFLRKGRFSFFWDD